MVFVCGPSNLFHAINQLCPCFKSHEYVSIGNIVYCKQCFKKFTLQSMPRCTNVLHVFSLTMNNVLSIECLECLKSTFIIVDVPLISPIYLHQLDKSSRSTLTRCVKNALQGESRPLNKEKVSKKIKSPILDEILLMIGYNFENGEYLLANVYEENCTTLLTYLTLDELGDEATIMGLSYFIDGLSLVYQKSKEVALTDYSSKSVAPVYQELGCIDFEDDLIIYAFRKALATTKELVKYTTLLQKIGLGRSSTAIMLVYYPFVKYVDAFNWFGTSNSNELESFYIGLYRLKCSDVPDEVNKSKKMLQYIGEYIESNTILQMCHSSDELTGLGNSGVSCHLNSCIQFLAHVEPFRSTLALNNNDLSVLLRQLFKQMSLQSYVFPNQDLIEILFGAAQQQDASECLEKILDLIGPDICNDIFGFKIDNNFEYLFRLDVNTPIEAIMEQRFRKFPNILIIQINVITN